MALILLIDTTETRTSVGLADNGIILSYVEEESPNSHAQKITVFVQKVLDFAGKKLTDLEAVSLNSGPGSYTGLRIGSSTAKGLCLGLGIPLIAMNGLEVMAYGLIHEGKFPDQVELFCPILDARRMEVFMAVFDSNLNTVVPSSPKIIDQDSFFQNISPRTIFFGSGSSKLKSYLEGKSPAEFELEFKNSAINLRVLSENAFQENRFENLVDYEPLYLKEFYSPHFQGGLDS